MPDRRPADPGQLTQLAILFDGHGIGRDRRTDRLRLCSDHAGRHLTSSAELTRAEAETLISRLQRLPKGCLPRVVAELVAAEEDEAAVRASGALLCGPKPSRGDLAQVAEFARFLEQAGPAPGVRLGVDVGPNRDDDDVAVEVEVDGQLTLLGP